VTKEQVSQKIKEILAKDKSFDSAVIKIKFTDKKRSKIKQG
jgi:hypothetical protein